MCIHKLGEADRSNATTSSQCVTFQCHFIEVVSKEYFQFIYFSQSQQDAYSQKLVLIWVFVWAFYFQAHFE